MHTDMKYVKDNITTIYNEITELNKENTALEKLCTEANHLMKQKLSP